MDALCLYNLMQTLESRVEFESTDVNPCVLSNSPKLSLSCLHQAI